MANWSSFQSVIQLGIALNCAFATLAPFLGTSSQDDRLLIDDYLRQLDYYQDQISKHKYFSANNKVTQSLTETQSALFDIKHASSQIDLKISTFLNGIIRAFCLSCAALSLIALFISSYAASNATINDFWHVFLYVQFLPFVVGVGRIMALAIKHSANRKQIKIAAKEVIAIENNFLISKQLAAKGGA